MKNTMKTMKKTMVNKALYEKIMRNVSREVKKALNEYNYWSWEDRTWHVIFKDKPEIEEFFDKSMEAYETWIEGGGYDTIVELMNQGKVSENKDDSMDAWDIIEKEFDESLYEAVKHIAPGNDWWEIGKHLGYDDEDLEQLYVDVMQAKTDCLGDFSWEDDDEEY